MLLWLQHTPGQHLSGAALPALSRWHSDVTMADRDRLSQMIAESFHIHTSPSLSPVGMLLFYLKVINPLTYGCLFQISYILQTY